VTPTTGLPLRPFALDSHFDVMRVLSNWERGDAVRLDIVAELLGLAKSPPGMDGSQVLGLWRAGRVEEIEAYCLGDVRLVYEVYLRIRPSSTDPSRLEQPARCRPGSPRARSVSRERYGVRGVGRPVERW
jgi:hypothetical protein